MTKPIFIFMGPQGSGKSVQAELAAKNYKIPLFNTGFVLRRLAKKPTPQGKILSDILKKGELAPDSIVEELFFTFLQKNNDARGYVLDAFPRGYQQYLVLSKLIIDSFPKIKYLLVGIYLTISPEIIKKRIEFRKSHEKIKRIDNSPMAINRRLQIYQKETLPIIDDLRSNHILYEISGEPPISEVEAQVKECLGVYLKP